MKNIKNNKPCYETLKSMVSSLADGWVALFFKENGKFYKKVSAQSATERCLFLCEEAGRTGMRVAKAYGDFCSNCGHREKCPGFPKGTL